MFRAGKFFYLGSLCLTLLGGCANSPFCVDNSQEVRLFRTPSEFMVNQGIRNYEEGNYPAALTIFQNLVSNKKATKNEKIVAYKYMAFTHCVSPNASRETREKLCRDDFKKAFELNPSFNLTPAEAGHPVWGPIFSSVKNTQKK